MVCADCGEEPEQYLVRDALWRSAGMQIDDGLCLACLATRVGRPLRRRDFIHGWTVTQSVTREALDG